MNGPRPSPTVEPPADAVSWCWGCAERRPSWGEGRTIRPEKPKVVEFGGGVVGPVRVLYSWKVNCKIVAVIILAFGKLIFRLSSQRTAHCNAKAGNWHYVRTEKRPTVQRRLLQAGFFLPHSPTPTPHPSPRRGGAGCCPRAVLPGCLQRRRCRGFGAPGRSPSPGPPPHAVLPGELLRSHN